MPLESRRYLTTTLPYVNSEPHLGHALEFTQADALARFWRAQGWEVFFNVGTDEHGQKIYQKALEAGEDPQVYVDRYAERFEELCRTLGISYTRFIRTTDPQHTAAAQEFWRRCEAAGDIYKAVYQTKYCVGCELEKTDSELVDGRCPLHPNIELEEREEENYFFRFSRYQEPLLRLYGERADFVVPDERLREVRAFVERGLKDFSISRLREKMPWGIPVPGDPTHVMYVWFDALVNYLSAIGWPDDPAWETWWPVIQLAGKDNLRQQAAMWQAMLLSAGVEPSRQIIIHGFITSQGQKMSKTVGNVISPLEIIDAYGVEALRYFLLRHTHPFEDTDITRERLAEWYEAHLANGLGNTVARVVALAEKHLPDWRPRDEHPPCPPKLADAMGRYHYADAMDALWEELAFIDEDMAKHRTYELVRAQPEEGRARLAEYLERLWLLAMWLSPFMPQTAATIRDALAPPRRTAPLFPRGKNAASSTKGRV